MRFKAPGIIISLFLINPLYADSATLSADIAQNGILEPARLKNSVLVVPG